MKHYITTTLLLAFLSFASCNTKKEEEVSDEPVIEAEDTAPVTDTVTEVIKPKIERPEKSTTETTLNTSLLYKTWVNNPNDPHADFVLSKKSFYVVDYDGDGDMPYILNGNDLTIYYTEFIQHAKILSVTETTLVLQWQDVEEPTSYVVWKG